MQVMSQIDHTDVAMLEQAEMTNDDQPLLTDDEPFDVQAHLEQLAATGALARAERIMDGTEQVDVHDADELVGKLCAT